MAYDTSGLLAPLNLHYACSCRQDESLTPCGCQQCALLYDEYIHETPKPKDTT